MIAETMQFVADQLNSSLGSVHPADEDRVVVSHVVSSDGSTPTQAINRLALTLVNVQRSSSTEGDAGVRPSLGIDLDVLVSASFADDRYPEALRLLWGTIDYFEAHPVFTRHSAPGLPMGVDRLSVEWLEHDLRGSREMWTVLGGRYLPSVLYKLRTSMVGEDRFVAEIPTISGVGVNR